PTHPAMKEAVDEYRRVVNAAQTVFLAAIEKAIADYKAACLTDSAKTKPLYAAPAVVQRPELMGVWERKSESQAHPISRELWIVDVNRASGELQVDSITLDTI